MKILPIGPFSGMNNRAKDTALPQPSKENPFGKVRNAVNVVFDNANQIVYPAPGKTLRYTGSVKWVHKGKHVTIFLEDTTLKRLNSDNTATTLKIGFGSTIPDVTSVGDTLYVSNGTGRGKVDASGNYHPWGTPRPPRNPDVAATDTGGLFAGEYRVTMTWISDDGEEGGCGIGRRVTVPAGGGISLSNFPTPPSGVDKLAIYVTSVNGKDFYKYDEYPAARSSITLSRKVCTIPLLTQFGYVPMPNDILCHHYGRIYYWRGSRLYKTATRRLGVQFALQFMRFDSNGTIIASVPNMLYVGTEKRVYRVSNLDGDGAPIIEALLEVGAVKGSVTYDDAGDAYFMTARGFVKATPEGLQELTFAQVAMPSFQKGTMTTLDHEGSRYLIGIFQDGTQSPLADSEYNAAEIAAGRL
jgi:hypothetical protein